MTALPAPLPTPAEYARMSWHARRRLADRRRQLVTDSAAYVRAEAERLLALITPDDPLVVPARREQLLAEVTRRTP